MMNARRYCAFRESELIWNMMRVLLIGFVFCAIGFSSMTVAIAQEEMKVRAFALKPGSLSVQAAAASGQGVNVIEQLQKEYDIDLGPERGVQAVYLPKEQALVLRAPQKTIDTIRTRMARVIDRTRPAASGTPAVMQARLDSIIVSEVNFKQASSDVVAEYIREVAKPYGITVQMLSKSDAEAMPSVTLELRNIPLSALLKYYTTLTRLPHRVQANDVLVEY